MLSEDAEVKANSEQSKSILLAKQRKWYLPYGCWVRDDGHVSIVMDLRH